ncbi:hypothetical protein ABE444_00810 [Brevundimonas pondensis]|uniref:hypothetical protein n=1 Tax=Brevundimonas pondensis TaxID=2774189 RepID=UPI00320A6C48
MTRSWLDAVERSWLLKLVWLGVPYIPLTAIALSNHAKTDGGPGLLAALPMLAVLTGVALPFLIGLAAQPAKQARRRALSPLQRMQMSEEADMAPLTDTLRIDEKPPVETLPALLQSAIAVFGAPPPRLLSGFVSGLSVIAMLALLPMALMSDPLGALSRWTGLTLPLAYWPTYWALLTLMLFNTLWRWLRQMHDHYVAEAQPTGRRPFPALRS